MTREALRFWMRETALLTAAIAFAMFCFWQAVSLTSQRIAELAYALGAEETRHDSLHVDREIDAFLKRATLIPMPREYGGIAWVLVSCEETP